MKRIATVLLVVFSVVGTPDSAYATPEVRALEARVGPDARQIIVEGRTLARARAPVVELGAYRISEPLTDVVRWTEAEDGRRRSYFRFRVPGRTWSEVIEAEPRLSIKHGRFDPVSDEPASRPGWSPRARSRLRLVQFHTRPLPAYRAFLESRRVEILRYIPSNAFLVNDPLDVVPGLTGDGMHGVIRWTDTLLPEWKVEPNLMRTLLGEASPSDFGVPNPNQFHVAATSSSHRATLVTRLETIGSVVVPSAGLHLIATLDLSDLRDLVKHDDVAWIQWRFPPGTGHSDNARCVMGADHVETNGFITGIGITGHVFEAVQANHSDFGGPPPTEFNPYSASSTGIVHGTKTYSVVFGDGATKPEAKGILPSGKGIYTPKSAIGSTPATTRYGLTADLLATHPAVRFQVSAWGGAHTDMYLADAEELDSIVFDLGISAIQSMGNCQFGPAGEGWSKNAICVGSVRHDDDCVLSTGGIQTNSKGPSPDGRLKPDICAFGDNIAAATSSSYSTTAHTSNHTGTSAAAAIVAGFAGVVQEMWSWGMFGNPVSAAGPRGNRASPAMVKALLLCSATQYRFDLAAFAAFTRPEQGWGYPNAKRLFEKRTKIFVSDQEHPLEQTEQQTFYVIVSPGEPTLKVTMAYTDPPASPIVGNPGWILTNCPSVAQSSSWNPGIGDTLVNDLDLSVESPTGTVYRGNHQLESQPFTTAGGGNWDRANNVENVFIRLPSPGVWTIRVRATSVPIDGHPGTPEVDQPFALVALGVLTEVVLWANYDLVPHQHTILGLEGIIEPRMGGPPGRPTLPIHTYYVAQDDRFWYYRERDAWVVWAYGKAPRARSRKYIVCRAPPPPAPGTVRTQRWRCWNARRVLPLAPTVTTASD